MKIFVYKTLFIFLMIILLFHFTVGPILKNVEQKISNINSKENVEYMKDKIRDELNNAIAKENYLEESDRKLIISFIDKLKSELKVKP
jgi:hypothetical protein